MQSTVVEVTYVKRFLDLRTRPLLVVRIQQVSKFDRLRLNVRHHAGHPLPKPPAPGRHLAGRKSNVGKIGAPIIKMTPEMLLPGFRGLPHGVLKKRETAQHRSPQELVTGGRHPDLHSGPHLLSVCLAEHKCHGSRHLHLSP